MKSNQKFFIIGFFTLVAFTFIGRLFYLQVATDRFHILAESRLSAIEEIPAYRGIIYDRNGHILAYNKPVFQLQFIKKDVDFSKKSKICDLLNITSEEFDEAIASMKKSYLPGILIKEISQEDYAKIRDRFDFTGFQFVPKFVRAYPHQSLSNTLGYIAEISQRQLDRDTTNYYKSGDLIGFTGIEKTYEPYLKGKRGTKYHMLNRKRIRSGSFNEGKWDTLSEKGSNLYTTIDLELQQYGERLLANKIGGIVALDPNDGGVLSIVTSPSYDPNLLAGINYSKNSAILLKDSLKPLYNRAVQSKYPPGSIFKLIQSLIGLGDSSTTLSEQIYCPPGVIGDHAPPGYYNYHRGIMLSSNTYYVKLYYRMLDKGLDKNMYKDTYKSYKLWYNTLKSFGYGSKLGLDVANENSGFIPDTSYYDRINGKYRWYTSYIYSNAIGQGEIEMTPLQMANTAALIANKGFYYKPHVVRTIDGKTDNLQQYYEKQITNVTNPIFYDAIADAMEDVVTRGTARRAITKDIKICGKTGTIENKKGEDHSCFIAYAPKDNPQIAIAVYVENAGYGGRWAAPIASLMIEKYLKGTISNKRKEERVLNKRFINLLTEDETQ